MSAIPAPRDNRIGSSAGSLRLACDDSREERRHRVPHPAVDILWGRAAQVVSQVALGFAEVLQEAAK